MNYYWPSPENVAYFTGVPLEKAVLLMSDIRNYYGKREWIEYAESVVSGEFGDCPEYKIFHIILEATHERKTLPSRLTEIALDSSLPMSVRKAAAENKRCPKQTKVIFSLI